MATNISFVNCSNGLGDRAFDRHSKNGRGVFANESCPQGRAFNQFLPIPGVSRGRGMLAAGIDSHINHEHGLN